MIRKYNSIKPAVLTNENVVLKFHILNSIIFMEQKKLLRVDDLESTWKPTNFLLSPLTFYHKLRVSFLQIFIQSISIFCAVVYEYTRFFLYYFHLIIVTLVLCDQKLQSVTSSHHHSSFELIQIIELK